MRLVGQSVKRVEDDRLLRGTGRYVADVNPPGVLHAVFVRSTFAHARIVSIDAAAAGRSPGVVRIYTGAEINAMSYPMLPMLMLPDLYTPLVKALSDDKVRMVGDPVAVVLANSRAEAEDAAELVEVEYDPLDAVPDIATGLRSDSAQLWEKADGNVLYDHADTFGEVDAVFASADRVITERFSSHRQSNQPIETRGTVIEVDPVTGHLTVHGATQTSHMLRWGIAAYAGKRRIRESLKSLATKKERRAAFLTAAKKFTTDNADALKQSDNAGAAHQIKRDKSTLLHMNRMGLELLGQEDFPTVVAQDIGGGFGAKGAVAREDIALATAAIDLDRSVKWIEDRIENLTDGGHAREEDIEISIAVDDDGTMRGMKVDLVIDHGAYPAWPIGASLASAIMKVMFPGAYRFEAFSMRSRLVATNKGKYVAYRGPWANETWARERIIDVVARELRMSPAEIRLKNMYGPEDMPAAMLTGPTLDETMSTRATLERAIELIDRDELASLKADAEANGRRLGLGLACYHEAAPGPPNYNDAISPGSGALSNETARTVVESDGSIVAYTSQMPHGQSHETTYAQVVADEMGVGIDDVKLVWGNTDKTPFSALGTGGSRGGPLGGGAIKYASREVRRLVAEKAASMLEASVDDIEIVDGNIHVAGVPSRGLTYGEVAGAVATLDGEAFSHNQDYRGKGDGGWSCATHVCMVDIDLETGTVQIPRYFVVEDCGPIINPAIVDGQVRGGVAQGIGAVLYESAVFDTEANPQTTTYMDYLMPSATEIPEIEVHHLETLSPGGENDFRGVGEGGMIGAPAAITNAIEHALAPLGAKVTDQYLPPTKILELAGIIDPDRSSGSS
ncbi:MAG: xanthine dehydrogenase family protein molybdopterin-binding subunit [Actinomycetia bacterium]|nr:xanthine dehydrogenase family protein molybdopterin-binding subunit [Actinomycetes bacterium]